MIAASLLLYYGVATGTMFRTLCFHPLPEFLLVVCHALLVLLAAFIEVILHLTFAAGSSEAPWADMRSAILCGEVRGAIRSRAFDVSCWILSKVCRDRFGAKAMECGFSKPQADLVYEKQCFAIRLKTMQWKLVVFPHHAILHKAVLASNMVTTLHFDDIVSLVPADLAEQLLARRQSSIRAKTSLNFSERARVAIYEDCWWTSAEIGVDYVVPY